MSLSFRNWPIKFAMLLGTRAFGLALLDLVLVARSWRGDSGEEGGGWVASEKGRGMGGGWGGLGQHVEGGCSQWEVLIDFSCPF